ncbi:ABC transporter substrate-binding protein [Ruania alba]|uniref:Carbohydrate ABC transporter substrate-binding protein, CUT1 family n=1 Tax=Ruania alba TaxID=648782 RepID=A0A1H5LE51_9MICO|nr:sugar ABC transporter substrate-binding protein [Ruania alba]SEE74651.1 carbohydrate ABC transporter substrate-binding protein, CUT1 family [Ruania alba]
MTLHRKRTHVGVAALAASAVLLAACGGTDGSDDAPHLTVLMEEISYTDNIREMLPEFEAATGITVDLETVPYADQASRILQEFAQGSDTYDVVFNDNVYGSGYFESGYVLDVTEYATGEDEFGTLDEFYDPYLAPMTTEDGAVYGVPVYGESTFLMYRTDLFAEHGIDGPPQTTAELEEAARTISEGTNGEVAGITMRGTAGIHALYPWAGLLRSFGGDFFDADGQIAVDSPEAVEATEYWANLLSEYGPAGVANFDWEQNRIAFTQGQAAMTIDATANGPYNEDAESSTVAGNVGYAPIPYAPGVEPGENTNNSLAVHSLYLNANSSNPEAAWSFMAWATSQEVQEGAVASVEAVGVTNEAVLNGDAYAERYGAFQEAVLDQLATGNLSYLPSGQSANTVIVETGQALSNALSGQQSAEEALAAAAESISTQLG